MGNITSREKLLSSIRMLRAHLPPAEVETPEMAAERLLDDDNADLTDIAEALGLEVDELIMQLEGFKQSLVNHHPELRGRFRVGMPEIVVELHDGHANVTGANRQVHVHLVDLDQDGPMDNREIDEALEGETVDGDALAIAVAVESARDFLIVAFGQEPTISLEA